MYRAIDSSGATIDFRHCAMRLRPNDCEAVSALDEALAMVRNSRTFFYEAELYRLRGNALMGAGTESLQEVDTCLQQALEAARRYGTRSLELRAAVSLARFWRDHGKSRQVRELLAGVYNGFTEGFGTADLAEAMAMLNDVESGSRAKPG